MHSLLAMRPRRRSASGCWGGPPASACRSAASSTGSAAASSGACGERFVYASSNAITCGQQSMPTCEVSASFNVLMLPRRAAIVRHTAHVPLLSASRSVTLL